MGGLKNIDKNIQQLERLFVASINQIKIGLAEVGLKCMNIARSVPYEVGFEDKTGALRSSIGFAVFYNGQCLSENFEPITTANNDSATLSKTQEGADAGVRFAHQIGEKTEGWNLIICAGMNYAHFLESGTSRITARDVLTSAEHYAMQHSEELTNIVAEQLSQTLGEIAKIFKSII